jgi:dipeptidyl aminopeptidase/acylaminoacyl peptidase
VTTRRFGVLVGADEVVGVLHAGEGARRRPCVVACHGMGASKDSDKYLMLGERLPAAGLALARFDFRGSGESGGRYADATIESRIADLEAVLDHLAKQPELNGRFGLLGSSLGGFVALWVAASRRHASPDPPPVVTWNAPAALHDLATSVDPADPTGPGPALVAEVRRGDYAEAAAGASYALIVQADRDEVVPPEHGRRLFERATRPKRLHVIVGADHRLSDMRHRLEALEETRHWLGKYLGANGDDRP